MSTLDERTVAPLALAEATMAFVLAFDAWVKKASMSNAGESVARLRLLNELHCRGPRKMAELADVLGVTPRNITALVDALEAEQQLRRVPHPTDRRITMVEITGGSASVEAGFAALGVAIDGLFAEVGPADRAVFGRVLSALVERIEAAEVR
jgi:DNA-binding MarR family transcriptional regulator